jgi:hypothetical protein
VVIGVGFLFSSGINFSHSDFLILFM